MAIGIGMAIEMGMGKRVMGMEMRMVTKAQAGPWCWRHGGRNIFGAPGGGNLGALAQRDAGRHREASYYRLTTEPRLIAREQGVGDSGHNMAALDEDSSFSREAGG